MTWLSATTCVFCGQCVGVYPTGANFVLFKIKGGQTAAELQGRLLRDHRTGEVHRIDPALFDLLSDLHARTGGGTFEVISGFRSSATNAMLRGRSHGVAEKSLHLVGQAIDVRLQGVPLANLRGAALAMRRGGVGFYPDAGFVHLDTGRVRFW